MLLPYRSDVYVDREPRANIVLLIVLAVCFLLSLALPQEGFSRLLLHPSTLFPGALTHMFLHAGLLHLAGNGIVLWTFGNAVNCRLGNLPYTIVFLGLGLFAAAAHVAIDPAPALGASGAINGVVGLYAGWFPRSRIHVLVKFIAAWNFRIRAYVLILLWLLLDLIGAVMGASSVAYHAHLAGFAGGIVLAYVLWRFRLVTFWQTDHLLFEIGGEPQAQHGAAPDETWERDREGAHGAGAERELELDRPEERQPEKTSLLERIDRVFRAGDGVPTAEDEADARRSSGPFRSEGRTIVPRRGRRRRL